MPRRKSEEFSWKIRIAKIFSTKKFQTIYEAVNYILFKGINILSTENI